MFPDLGDREKLSNDIAGVFTGVRLASGAKTQTLCFVSESPRLSLATLQEIASAVQLQIANHVAPAWGRAPWRVTYAASRGAAPKGAIVVVAVPADPSTPDALGWHTEDADGRVFGEIAVDAVLDNGGTLTEGANSVSCVFSHEAIETFLDAAVSTWDQSAEGALYAHEGCDAVEGDSYLAGQIAVSNFVLPPFFDAQAPKGTRFDFLGKLSAPFTMAPGGYQVMLTAQLDAQGQPVLTATQIFGASMPQWKRSAKLLSRRRATRGLVTAPCLPKRLRA
jgi:hypothetical protein